jgi:4-hydroxythreonine-4-phosphate dehydrogenase
LITSRRSDSLRIAITFGDPRGVGPEIAAAAVRARAAGGSQPSFVFVGPDGTGFESAADEFISIGRWSDGGEVAAGRLAGLAIERATALALSGDVHAVVTGPIDKAALNAGGYAFPGHTEMLAHLAGTPAVVMMMCAESTLLGGALRVVLATTHLPLRDVAQKLSIELITQQTRVTIGALQDGWGIARPRVALCAFNPHASDNGLFGDEEARILVPARDLLQGEDLDVSGPLSADTVFVRALRGEFDVVIAPYHDVGMAAFKTATFGQGVNVTLGLPFVRTSPDHGTAIDIAGRGLADASSMLHAIRLAERLGAPQLSAAT